MLGPWLLRAVGLGVALWPSSAWAMDQCPAGTGPSPWLPLVFWGAIASSVVLVIVRVTVLSTVPGEPRPRRQDLVVFFAVVSPFMGCGVMLHGILTCPAQTQAPEVVCEHFAAQAEESREPVGFDVEACVEVWRAEQERLGRGEYRDLSSCARRVWLGTMDRNDCADVGFEPERHAPGSWPSDQTVERWRSESHGR